MAAEFSNKVRTLYLQRGTKNHTDDENTRHVRPAIYLKPIISNLHIQALERYRKSGGPLKCKQCVNSAEAKERELAAAKRLASSSASTSNITSPVGTICGGTDTTEETLPRTCAGCQQELECSAYNRNQWNKGDGKSKCRTCVDQSIQNEQQQQSQLKDAALAAAQEKVQQAHQSKSPRLILQAESELAALQAEQVTGLKPMKLSSAGRGGRRGGGGGRSTRGSGSGGVGHQGRSFGS